MWLNKSCPNEPNTRMGKQDRREVIFLLGDFLRLIIHDDEEIQKRYSHNVGHNAQRPQGPNFRAQTCLGFKRPATIALIRITFLHLESKSHMCFNQGSCMLLFF